MCRIRRLLLLHGLETVARGSANNYYFHGRKGKEGATKHSHLQNGSEADFIFITLNQILKQHRDMVSHKNQGFFFHAHMTRHLKLDEILSKNTFVVNASFLLFLHQRLPSGESTPEDSRVCRRFYETVHLLCSRQGLPPAQDPALQGPAQGALRAQEHLL